MKLSEYGQYDGLGLAELVRKGDVSPAELTELALTAIEKLNPELNCVPNVLADQARREVEQGLPSGPFTGVLSPRSWFLELAMSRWGHLIRRVPHRWDAVAG